MPLKVAYDIAPWTSLSVSSYADLLLTWSQVPGIMPTVAGALFLLVLVCVKTLSGEHVSQLDRNSLQGNAPSSCVFVQPARGVATTLPHLLEETVRLWAWDMS